jgi:hypothetical protein
MNNSFYTGFYSEEFAEKYGTVFYKNVDGKEIEVTYVSKIINNCRYEDQVIVATDLVEFVRTGREGTNETERIKI